MTTFLRVFGWIAEAAILAGLLYKHATLYAWRSAGIMLLAIPILALVHWGLLAQKRVPRIVKLRLFLVTGPCVLFAMSLVAELSLELETAA